MKKGKKDIPLPRQADIICICTDSPDHEQIAAARKGDMERETAEAFRTPEETSRNPINRAFSHSGA